MALPNTVASQGQSDVLPVCVRVVCVSTYQDEGLERKVAGMRTAKHPEEKPTLPSGPLKTGEDLRQAAARIFRELSDMPEYANRPSMWHVWTSRVTSSGELLVFVRRKSWFFCSREETIWLNSTPVVPVSIDTELDIPEMSDGIKACFRTRVQSNLDSIENPDLDSHEEFEEQNARSREAAKYEGA
jgi:hypothetical protein